MQITANKPTPSSKLGFNYAVSDDRVVVTKVSEGVLSSTELTAGQEIISINGTFVKGFSVEQVKQVLNTIKYDIMMEVESEPTKAYAVFRGTRFNAGEYQLNCSRDKPPALLVTAGVPLRKWQMIYESLTEMAVATAKSYDMDAVFQKECIMYEQCQSIRKVPNTHHLSGRHEDRVLYQRSHHCAVLGNNATLVATNVLAKANALLAPHGTMCALVMHTTMLAKYSSTEQHQQDTMMKPCGIEFMSVE